jgi:hypothetical protein
VRTSPPSPRRQRGRRANLTTVSPPAARSRCAPHGWAAADLPGVDRRALTNCYRRVSPPPEQAGGSGPVGVWRSASNRCTQRGGNHGVRLALWASLCPGVTARTFRRHAPRPCCIACASRRGKARGILVSCLCHVRHAHVNQQRDPPRQRSSVAGNRPLPVSQAAPGARYLLQRQPGLQRHRLCLAQQNPDPSQTLSSKDAEPSGAMAALRPVHGTHPWDGIAPLGTQ